MLMELIGGIFRTALIKLATLAAVYIASTIVVMAMAIYEASKLIRGCYIFLRTKIAGK